jgi:hypothetical protein
MDATRTGPTEMVEATFTPRSGASWRDPFPMYRALRDHAPVHYVEHGDYWVLSRFDDVFAAARDVETFSSASGLTFSYGEIEALKLAPTIVMMDPPEHSTVRRLVSRGFTPRAVQYLEPQVRAFTVARIEEMRVAGDCDFVAGLARPLPCFVVATYLGVPDEDRGLFDRWTQAIVSGSAAGDLLGNDAAAAAVAELYEYFGRLIARRRTDPGDDMISTLVAADIDGEPVGLLHILGYAFVMIAGGNDTTTGLLGGAAELLTEHPAERRRLLEQPARIPNAVEELLRLASPVQGLARLTTRDVTIDGRTIPQGKKVLLLYAAANRDEREFGASAETLDVGREIGRMLSFTIGPHFCLGAHAARLQGRIVLEELLARVPEFSVDAAHGVFAPGHYVRRYESLPFRATGDA